MPLEDPLQEEQDPKELLQAETLNNLAPNLAEAIILMTEQLCHRDAPIQKAKAKEPNTFDSSNESSITSFSFAISFSTAIPFIPMTLTK